MKRYLSILLSLSLILSLCSVASAEETAEVIYQTSFEDGWEGWEDYNKYTDDFVSLSKDCSTDGNVSVFVNDIKDSSAIGIYSPKFEINAGETYSASVDMLIVSGVSKLYFRFYDKNNKQLFNKSSSAKVGVWTNVVASYEAPKEASYAQILLCTDSKTFGEAYYDNFKFAKGTLNKEEILNPVYPKPKEKINEENQTPELMFTESFEDGLGTYTLYSKSSEGFVTPFREDAYDGEGSIKIVDNSDKTTAGIKSPFYEVEEGVKYTANFYIKNLSGSSTRLYFKYFDENKKQISSKSYNYPGEDWVPLSLTVPATEGAKYAQIQIVGVSGEKGDALVDMAQFYKGAYTPPKNVSAKYIPPVQKVAVNAEIIEPRGDKLVYNAYNDKGDKLSDFSYAGFFAGDYLPPESDKLEIVETLSPTGTKDDTAHIQAAIDRNERKDGKINIIKLNAGKYYINTTGIKIKSGVLLKGEGQGPNATILYAFEDKQYTAVRIEGFARTELLSNAKITDDYIKAGSVKIHIDEEKAQDFEVGDKILIKHVSTDEWAKAIKMVGTINVYGNDTTWVAGTVNMNTERKIKAINGNEITLDFPLYVPYMKELVQAEVVKFIDHERVENAGIENIRIESYFNGDRTDEAHAVSAIGVSNAKNIIIRDVTCKYFYFGLAKMSGGAKNVTVQNCSCLEPVSTVTGERRYSYCVSTGAQQVLVSGCYSYDARHDYAGSGQATGPVVFSDSIAEMSNTSTETHGTWATGFLYDNVYHIGNASKGFTAIANRGIYGTVRSQGWTGAGCVVWNGLATAQVIHDLPLSYNNFAVGIWGLYADSQAKAMKEKNINTSKKMYRTGESIEHTEENFATDDNTSIIGDSYKENVHTPVNPRSLFKAQLAERYTGSIKNAKPNAPIIINPRPDNLETKKDILVEGIYQLGAEKVIVYIDNKPYDAKLNKDDNTFTLDVSLEDGTHKIYATQVIDGVEGCKTADRFLSINYIGENKDYLQSIYNKEKTTLILNDPRPTYDEISNGIRVVVDDELLSFDVLPVNENGRVLVPLRAIFESLGATLLWDDATKTATATKKDAVIKITNESKTVYKNNEEVTLDVPAKIINGRFLVPVRFISETLGCRVKWVDETKTVIVSP